LVFHNPISDPGVNDDSCAVGQRLVHSAPAGPNLSCDTTEVLGCTANHESLLGGDNLSGLPGTSKAFGVGIATMGTHHPIPSFQCRAIGQCPLELIRGSFRLPSAKHERLLAETKGHFPLS